MAETWSLTVSIDERRPISVTVQKDCLIRDLRLEIKQASGSSGELRLYFNGTEVDDGQMLRLSDYGIVNGTHLTAREEQPRSGNVTGALASVRAAMMTLYVKLTGERTVTINIPEVRNCFRMLQKVYLHSALQRVARSLFYSELSVDRTLPAGLTRVIVGG